jgi:hypothetical protein
VGMLGGRNRGWGVGNEPSRSLRGSGVVARLLVRNSPPSTFFVAAWSTGTSSQRDGIRVLAPFKLYSYEAKGADSDQRTDCQALRGSQARGS